MTGSAGAAVPTPARRSGREWAARLFVLFLGIVIAHFGVTLFLLSALGADPFTLFAQGLASQLGTTVGRSHMLILLVLTAALLLTTRGYVLPGTLLCFVASGPFIDLYSYLLREYVNAAMPLYERIIVVVVGVIITGFGLAFLVRSRAGIGANDLIAVVASDKIPRVSFRAARMCSDAFFVSVGWCLGGVFGIGSLAAALLLGPVAQFFFPVADRLVARLLLARG